MRCIQNDLLISFRVTVRTCTAFMHGHIVFTKRQRLILSASSGCLLARRRIETAEISRYSSTWMNSRTTYMLGSWPFSARFLAQPQTLSKINQSIHLKLFIENPRQCVASGRTRKIAAICARVQVCVKLKSLERRMWFHARKSNSARTVIK